MAIDLYSKIHKGQRAWLFSLVVAAGKADPDDRPAVEHLRAESGRLAQHLRAHGEHEERFIHPLLREAMPGVEDRLRREHAGLDAVLAGVEAVAESGNAPALHEALTSLASQYLAHLEVEERIAMPALAHAFDDAALVARVLSPFASSTNREDFARDIAMQLAAVNPAESRQLLDAYARPEPARK